MNPIVGNPPWAKENRIYADQRSKVTLPPQYEAWLKKEV